MTTDAERIAGIESRAEAVRAWPSGERIGTLDVIKVYKAREMALFFYDAYAAERDRATELARQVQEARAALEEIRDGIAKRYDVADDPRTHFLSGVHERIGATLAALEGTATTP